MISVIMYILFSFPLKQLATLTGAPFLVIIILSGFISYIIAKTQQCIKCKDKEMGWGEFFYIFCFNMALISFTTIIGYPLIGFMLSLPSMSLAYILNSIKEQFIPKPFPLYLLMENPGPSSQKPGQYVGQNTDTVGSVVLR